MSIFKIPSFTDAIFSTEIQVRIDDINYGNHLGHDSLISLLHEARMRFLRKHNYSELSIHGLGILVTSLAIDYIKQSFYDDTLIIKIGIYAISKTSINFIYEVKNAKNNTEVAKAITTITFYDYENKKIAKVPNEFLQKLKINL